MTQEYPISATQCRMIRQHQEALQAIYTVILAGHDVTNAHVLDVTDTALVVEIPELPTVNTDTEVIK